MRVLIADDHRILRQGLINMLSDYPQLEVVGEASDGEEAVRQTESLMPDVVIMDISMPRMNGIEATQAIKERFPGVSVIGLSLHESADMAEPMRQAGAFAYLSKSGPIDDLISTIEQAALSGRPEER